MNLKHLSYFVDISKRESFTKAADDIYVDESYLEAANKIYEDFLNSEPQFDEEFFDESENGEE